MNFQTGNRGLSRMARMARTLGEGKFGNGAVTAAFGYLYNQMCLTCDSARVSDVASSKNNREAAILMLDMADKAVFLGQMIAPKSPWVEGADYAVTATKIYFHGGEPLESALYGKSVERTFASQNASKSASTRAGAVGGQVYDQFLKLWH